MSEPRAVRIPRSRGASATPPDDADRRVRATGPAVTGLKPNRAGTQRVVRLTVVFLVVLAALYAGFAIYARSSPGGATPGAQTALVEITLLAIVLALAGTILTLNTAPRAIGALPDGFVVVGRWGRRTQWTPLHAVTVRRVRRYPAGFLSGEDVDSVEVFGTGQRRRSYLIEAGLLPEHSREPPASLE